MPLFSRNHSVMVWKKTSLIYSKKTWNTCKYPMVKWLYSVCVNITPISDKNSISKFTHKVNILIVIMKLTGTIYTQSSLKLILFQTTKWCTTSLQPLQGITGKCTVWYILMFSIPSGWPSYSVIDPFFIQGDGGDEEMSKTFTRLTEEMTKKTSSPDPLILLMKAVILMKTNPK